MVAKFSIIIDLMRSYFVQVVKKVFLSLGFRIERYFPERDILIPKNIELDIFFDVGANVGSYVEQIRKQGYLGKVVSFEPTSAAHKVLLSQSLKDGNWSVYERCALGDKNGTIKINVSLNSYSSSVLSMSQLHLDAAPGSEFVSQESVPIFRISDVWKSKFSQYRKVGLKIDVQGFELDVLAGAIEILHFIEFIQIEMSLAQVYEGQSLYTDVDSLLRSYGFFLWKVLPGFCNPQTGQLLQFDGIYVREF